MHKRMKQLTSFVCQWRKLSSAAAELRTQLAEEVSAFHKAGTYKSERIITSSQDTEIEVKLMNGSKKKVLNFCANNYLGLSSHPRVVDAGKRALDDYGAGLSSVRFICGTQDLHKRLENKIAEFHGKEDSILYAACFDANAGLFEVMLTPEDAVISDELNHASIIDGIRLCKAQKHKYLHLSMDDLEMKLKNTQKSRRRLIVTDGAFSMDGDIAPLQDICALATRYNALVFIDECHATGFLGKTGRGTEELCGVEGKVDVINSTLGKALGGAMGGYTTGPKELIDLLRQRSRPYLFSNSLAPAVAGSALEVFNILEENPDLASSVSKKAKYFRHLMKKHEFDIAGHPDHPICPVMLGDARLASRMADELLDEGIYVIGFSYPVVPQGKARIRVQMSAAHTEAQIDKLAESFAVIRNKLADE